MDEHLLQLKREIREMIRLDFIIPEDIPEIELYMDQVTRFMDQHLEHNKRMQDDKILTKTMINNYTKNRLLPPPRNKKYSKEHIILLIYIYYLKNVLPIGDIQRILTPMTLKYFDEEKMGEIYNDIYELEKPQYFNIEAGTAKAAALVEKHFPEQEDEYLNKMALIFLLGYDMFSKKRLIEKLIDELPVVDPKAAAAEAKAEKKAEKAGKKAEKVRKAAARNAELGSAKNPGRKPAAKKTAAQKPAAKKSAAQKPASRGTAARKPVGKTAAKDTPKAGNRPITKTAAKTAGSIGAAAKKTAGSIGTAAKKTGRKATKKTER